MTTKAFLGHFGFETLRDLPDMEKLEDAGLLNREKLLANSLGARGAVGREPEFLDDDGFIAGLRG